MERFAGSVVWITGGGSGIGRALAVAFAREGADVAVSGRREDRLHEVVASMAALGRSALAVPCDVRDPIAIERAVSTVIARFGRIDVAVANAGTSMQARVEEASAEFWRSQFETNVIGLAMTARSALPELRRTRGRLVLIGSVAAFVPLSRGAPYAASKAAVRAIGHALGVELEGSGVSCTTLHPAFVTSEIVQVDNEGRFDPTRSDPRPAALTWTAEHAARVMLDAIARRDRERVLGAVGRVASMVATLAPGLVQALNGRLSRRR